MNTPFLINVIYSGEPRSGDYATKFIEETPEPFGTAPTLGGGTKTLEYTSNMMINGPPNIERRPKPGYGSIKISKISQKKINQLLGAKQVLERREPTDVTD